LKLNIVLDTCMWILSNYFAWWYSLKWKILFNHTLCQTIISVYLLLCSKVTRC